MITEALSKYSYFFLLSLISLVIVSCNKQTSGLLFDVKEFNSFSNFKTQNDTLKMEFNLDNAIKNGISLPHQKKEFFKVSFKVKNNGNKPEPFFYKVLYQNETYKFPELNSDGSYNSYADNNFYGSWLNGNSGFHFTKPIPSDGNFYEITDSIRIVGNPRNEQKYFGGKLQNHFISDNEIKILIDNILSTPEWFAKVKTKAKENNLEVTEQLKKDAKWVIASERGKGDENNRWKRNPRVGNYSFLLVIGYKDEVTSIPLHYRDVTVKDSISNSYKNPFAYYLDSKKKDSLPNLKVIKSNQVLKTKMKLDLCNGVYINPTKFEESANYNDTNLLVGFTDNLFNKAHVEQFIHHINKNFSLKNIPTAYDVTGKNYTQKQYKENNLKFKESELRKQFVDVTKSPGRTVRCDAYKNTISIINPGFNTDSVLKKENVGIKSRHGLTYGKFRAKIQFPKMISEDYVWNGLTCAFWLIYQQGKWNSRNICKSGYIPKAKHLVKREHTLEYSEIDIEIVKTSKYWTQSSYGGIENYPKDDGLNDNVMVTCTNWDLACSDPGDFNKGVLPKIYKGDTFKLHRWDQYYKALTSKFEYPQDLTLGKPLYYEIEWRPTEIIWRLGPTKDNMRTIGYMNERNTKIPDNQMLMVVTQEFHDVSWWPTAPFDQNKIPFPLKDIKGYIYEMEVE